MAVKSLAACAVSEEVVNLAETLKVLSDVNRLRIICLLFSGEKCVCEIDGGLDISQPLASHHLKVLLEAGLVDMRREGTWSYYALRRKAIEDLNSTFMEFLGANRMLEVYQAGGACSKPAD
jgi:ArsR family transcriptional regulator